MESGKSGRGGATALTTAWPCDSGLEHVVPELVAEALGSDQPRSNSVHDLVWDRVEFKMLRFNKLAVPGDFTDNLKNIRRLP